MQVEGNVLKRKGELMKLRNVSANAESGAGIVVQPEMAEKKHDEPSPQEIRQRAFEIHIERGGIYGCDLDDWLQAERELKEKYSTSSDEGAKSK